MARYVDGFVVPVPTAKLDAYRALAEKLKDDETVVFAWITYESREDRDRINAKVMEDPRLKDSMNDMPFDGMRMFWGGFKTIVEL